MFSVPESFSDSSDIFCPVELFAVEVTVSGYRCTLLKQLSLLADECVPVEVGGNSTNSNREPAGRPAANSSYCGPGSVCEGAAGDEPTVGRAIADTSRRDVAHGVRRLPEVWQLVCIVAGGHIYKVCK